MLILHLMVYREESIFIQVVETGSLKRAAETLGLDPSVVSRKIAALEARLATKLLNRSTRRSAPTEAGETYYREMRELLDQQTALETRIMGMTDKPVGRLTVAAPVDFGARFVLPVLSAMQHDFPELAVELKLGSQFSNLSEEGIDVAVRIGHLADSSLIARPLGYIPRAVVAAKTYWDEHTLLKSPQELEDHPFVFYLSGQRQETITFTEADHTRSVTVSGSFTANSMTAVRRLVMDGRGLHHGPIWAFEKELAAGSVTRILPNLGLRAFPVQAVMLSRNYIPAKVNEFTRRVRAALQSEPNINTA